MPSHGDHLLLEPAPPCAAMHAHWQPCAADCRTKLSKSKRRVLRDRRVAIRKALISTNGLKAVVGMNAECDSAFGSASATIDYKLTLFEQRLQSIQESVEYLVSCASPMAFWDHEAAMSFPGTMTTNTNQQCDGEVLLQELGAWEVLPKSRYSQHSWEKVDIARCKAATKIQSFFRAFRAKRDVVELKRMQRCDYESKSFNLLILLKEVQELKQKHDDIPFTPIVSPERICVYRQYKELICKHFGYNFSQYAKCERTSLTRHQFEIQYDPMHRSTIWKLLCEEYDRGTGDPLCKADSFLQLARLAYDLWHEPNRIQSRYGHFVPESIDRRQ